MRSWVVGCTAVLVTCFMPGADARVPGGWSKVSVEDPGVVAAATFAIVARQSDRGQGDGGARLALVEIVEAEQQVVAGMNYRITLRVKVGDDERRAEAVVWSRPWLEDASERLRLTAWRFLDE